VVVLHIDVRNYVVVDQGVFAWSEVPRFIFGEVFSVFEALQFVVKVEHIVGLFITKSTVTICS
jgi:hypothetical protein